MTPDRNERIQEIFTNALERAEGAARDAYLAEACDPDAELRALVEALLRAHRNSMGFMRTLEMEPSDGGEGPGTVIGRYKLLQRIGEGGFGVVYMAEQQEPVRRKVALKIIKLGMDTREVIARFEAERQALALMDHPSIAQVFDGGITERAAHEPEGGARHSVRAESPSSESGAQGTDAPYPLPSVVSAGRPYFVMELVKGIPLTEYCDQEHLPATERLHLFIQVCHAVQHAHQKGVIHRDLKPSNILVTLHDGKPVPKIIDFGIAKAIGQPLTDKTLFTRFEQMIGTPAYMSPEQAALSGLDVDTRSDIYSLGVLLYELLTGTTPVQRETLHQVALDEIRRMIRETEPPKPSTRLYALVAADVRRLKSPGGRPPTEEEIRASSRRLLQIKEAVRLVRGDLDWIVMKALEKDRQRRYESAGVFAMDIERHLNHEPVTACPPSPVYRTRKFVRRHRVGVAMAAVVTVALLAGLTLALAGFTQARWERERAKSEAAIAAAVNEFLQKDLLEQADPENEPDRELKLRTVLDRAAAKIEDQFTNQPLVEAAIRLTLGQTYLGLGEVKAAEPHLRRAVELRTHMLGAEHPDTLEAVEKLGELLLDSGKYDEAQRFLEGLSETEQRLLGPEHTNTLETLHALATALLAQKRTDRAERLFREVLEKQHRLLGPEHPSVLNTMSSLARLYSNANQWSSAAEMEQELLSVSRRLRGAESPATLTLAHSLAENYMESGRTSEALPLLESVVETRGRVLGTNHPNTLLSMGLLGEVCGRLCLWKRCVEIYRPLALATNSLMESGQYWFFGGIAAAVVGDTNSYRDFTDVALRRLPSTAALSSVRMVVEVCLLQRDSVSDLEEVLRLADLVASDDWPVKGFAEYRRGNWQASLEYLEPTRRCAINSAASQAGYFCAMAHHQMNAHDAAKAAFDEAGKRLAACVGSGVLSPNTWHEYARVAVTRAEAERLILGREMSTLIDAAWLDQARKRYAPVHHWLAEGDRFLGRREWRQACDAYKRAIEDPVFDWGTVESYHLNLASRLGASFLLARDYEAHERLCRFLFPRLKQMPDSFISFHYSRAWLAKADQGDPDLLQQAVEWSKGARRESDQIAMLRGMAEYRSARYEEALQLLKGTQQSKSLARVAVGQLFTAMALSRLGRNEEAATLLKQAEVRLALPLERLSGDWYYDMAYCQLALDEARQLLGQTNVPAAQPVSQR